jgi:hypothetical protein
MPNVTEDTLVRAVVASHPEIGEPGPFGAAL